MFEILSRVFSRGGVLEDSADERIVDRAIEAVVAGTDPRLRLIPDYRTRLSAATKVSIAHVRRIAENLSSAKLLNAESYRSDPVVHLVFGSFDSMKQMLGRDATLRTFKRDLWRASTSDAFGLLLAERQVKHVLGMELHGETIQREVRQAIVEFSNYRLRALATSEAETLRLIRIGAFHQLINLAGTRLVQTKEGLPITAVDRQRSDQHLHNGPDDLQEDFPVFDESVEESTSSDRESSRLEEIDRRRQRMGAGALRLDDYLDIVSLVLSNPHRYLRHHLFAADVDRMNILVTRQPESGPAPERVSLWEFVRPDRTTPVAAIMVRLRKGDFPLIPEVSRSW